MEEIKNDQVNNIIKKYKAPPKLDLSKIANLSAIQKVDREEADIISTQVVKNPHKAAKRKFNFLEPQEIRLPSGGKFYKDAEDEDLRKGIIKMYPMSLSEEEILTNQAYVKSGRVFEILFDACMASTYKAENILNYDSMYLLYSLRKISYGDDYIFKEKCSDCDNVFENKLNISDVEWEELPEDAKEEYTIKLPISKYTVTLKMPRIKDENEVARMRNNNKENLPDRVIQLLGYTTEILNDNGEQLEHSDWKDFFLSIPGSDRSELTKSKAFLLPYPQTSITCPKCGNTWFANIPIDPDFFRLS